MTAKDYEMVAEVLASERARLLATQNHTAIHCLNVTQYALAVAFAKENVRFNAVIFHGACRAKD